jgi:hypothetical protein
MLIQYNISHAFYPGADKTLNARTLRVLMRNLIELNLVYLEEAPRLDIVVPPLYASGVVYDRTNWWEPIAALYERGFGDCKSLTAAWVAQQRMRGVKCIDVHRWVENDEGGTDYHILAHMGGSVFEDPSKRLGMGEVEVAKFFGPKSWAA